VQGAAGASEEVPAASRGHSDCNAHVPAQPPAHLATTLMPALRAQTTAAATAAGVLGYTTAMRVELL
jgi:hypothetical protein